MSAPKEITDLVQVGVIVEVDSQFAGKMRGEVIERDRQGFRLRDCEGATRSPAFWFGWHELRRVVGRSR